MPLERFPRSRPGIATTRLGTRLAYLKGGSIAMAPDPWRPLPAAVTPLQRGSRLLITRSAGADPRGAGCRVHPPFRARLPDPFRLRQRAPRLEIRASDGYHSAGVAAPAPRLLFPASPCVKTYVAKPSDRQRDWLLVDARGKTLGRLATQIADMLRGKRKPEYTPHIDTGDFVVVVNAARDPRHRATSGAAKMYHRHSGYPGGLRTRTLEEMLRAAARGGDPARGEGHAAPQPARPPAAAQAEGLRGAGSPARGAAAARRGGGRT